jgi:hypothetical protein
MNIFKELNRQDDLAFYRFDISTVKDVVIIKYIFLPIGYKNKMLQDADMHIIQINVKNIPAIISALYRIFQTPDGGDIWDLQENGDKIRIMMVFDDRGKFNSIFLSDESRRIKTDLINSIEFVFEKPFYDTDPLPRIPTPSMVLFTDTLKQIHDEWEKQQSGGQGAQV